jgi:hypothetical protein
MSRKDKVEITSVEFAQVGEHIYWFTVPEGMTRDGMTGQQLEALLQSGEAHGPFESGAAAQADADRVTGEGHPVIPLPPRRRPYGGGPSFARWNRLNPTRSRGD